MTFSEWFAEYEMRRDHLDKMSGKMTASEIDEIDADNELTDEDWWSKYGAS